MLMQNLMKKSTLTSDIEPMITYGTNPGMGLEFLKAFQTLKMLLKEKKLMLNL
jgi:hypothetical protein